MILDVLVYLKADAALDTLLGSTGSDSKIYPNQAPQGVAVPYIAYSISGDGTLEENLFEQAVTFDCVAKVYNDAIDIRDRLNELLDKQDRIKNFITSATYRFYWCKNVTGADVKEPEQDYFHKTLVFNFKYAKL